jgi:hypothetical protein
LPTASEPETDNPEPGALPLRSVVNVVLAVSFRRLVDEHTEKVVLVVSVVVDH